MVMMHFPWQAQTVIGGHASAEFAALKKEFQRIQPSPQNGGAALAVYFRGEPVVDLWSGWRRMGEHWMADSMALSYSTGKGVLSTLVHRLVDQGLLAYDRPIADYWPAFAQNGKASMTLRHILSHESGLYDIRHVIQSAVVMLNWDAMVAAYEQASPRFMPATDVAYQALSYGWLLGGLIEKVMKESLAATLYRELVVPLGMQNEAFFGVPPEDLERVARPFARAEPPSVRPVTDPKVAPPSGLRPLTMPERLLQVAGQNPYDADDALKPRGIGRFNFHGDRPLQACIPAANGVFTARALARMYAMLAGGGVLDGQVYLSDKTFRLLSQVQNRQRDRVMPIPMHWRMGYHRVLTLGKRASTGFGHIGYNGSGAWCDPSRELSMAYIHSFGGGSITGDYRLWWLTQRTLQLADQALTGRAGWR
jgi:CubicO group peptidase (beta-lactamase class C family)